MHRFSKGARFLWNKIAYEVVQTQPGQDVQVMDLANGSIYVVDAGAFQPVQCVLLGGNQPGAED